MVSSVKKNARAVAYVYGAWCLLWVVLALFDVAESRISGHIALAITGMPMALASLYLPNGSLQAIVVAALLGLGQWVGLVAWWSTDYPERSDR